MKMMIRVFLYFAAVCFILNPAGARAQVAWWDFKDGSDSAGGQSNINLVGDFGVGIATAGGSFITTQVNAANSDGLAAAEGPSFGFGWLNVGSGHELAISGSITVFVRVWFNSFNGTDDIIRIAASNTVDRFAMELVNGRPQFKVRSGAVESTVVAAITLAPRAWYDITGVYNAATQTLEMHIYSAVNGNLVSPITTATAPTSIDVGGDLLIFEDLNGVNGINDGAVLETAAIWDSALPGSVISALSATLPTVQMTSPVPPGTTNSNWIPVTATFSEPVVGFELADLFVTNASVLNFNASSSSTAYTFILVPQGSGTVRVDIPSNSAFSIGTGLGNKASFPFTRNFQVKPPPSVTLTSAVPPGVTAVFPIPVTATFNEDVTGFTVLDLNPSNAIVTNFNGPVVGSVYTFDLEPTGLVDFHVSIPLDIAKAVSTGLGNQRSNMFTRTYARPTVTLSTSIPTVPTSIRPFPITATFSMPITGFTAADVQLVNATLIFNQSSSGTVFTFAVDPISDGVVIVRIPDGAVTAQGGVLTNEVSPLLTRTYDQFGVTFPAAIRSDHWTLY